MNYKVSRFYLLLRAGLWPELEEALDDLHGALHSGAVQTKEVTLQYIESLDIKQYYVQIVRTLKKIGKIV